MTVSFSPERTLAKLLFRILILTMTVSNVGVVLVSLSLAQTDGEGYWPQWRGPHGTGVSLTAQPPIDWHESSDGDDRESKNIRWKIQLPGSGHSTPVIWNDRLFVTTAVPVGPGLEPRYSRAVGAHDNIPVTHKHRFEVLGLARNSGRVLWRQVVHEAVPHEGGHYTASQASASPITDGQHVYAFFGSAGLFCLNLKGQLLWKVQLGTMQTKHGHGEGSTPVLHGDSLVINWDHEGASFVVALDKRTGEERWRVLRDEVTSWATPIVVEHQGTRQVVVSGTQRVRAYDLHTGKEIWSCGGLSHNIVASPVAAKGLVFAASSYETRNLLAIMLDGAKGDVTETDQVVWSTRRLTPYVPSLLVYDDTLYFLRHYQGIVSRLDIHSGQPMAGPLRLNGIRDVYASPVAAANRIYITDLDGTTAVLAHDRVPRLIAVNRLRESVSASAALVDSELYLRGSESLYCLAEEASDP